MKHFDLLILGQGIAGSCLAWAARWAGKSCAIIDDPRCATASRVAAGLITPITGRRLATTWRLAEFWPVARSFYHQVETETGCRLLAEAPACRLFANAAEQEMFAKRRPNFGSMPNIREVPPTSASDPLIAPWGGFEMFPAARLDVTGFLQQTRETFSQHDACYASRVHEEDIEVSDDRVVINSLGLSGEQMVFCQGVDAREGTWFAPVRFNPAKGEILTVRIPGLERASPVHRSIWLAGEGESTFRVGATYDWERHDCVPTNEGREWIAAALNELVRVPFEILDHVAAVRPAAHDFRPIVGLHPEQPRVGILNGLGSKGSLQGPYFARQLIQVIIDHAEGRVPRLDRDVDVRRYWREPK